MAEQQDTRQRILAAAGTLFASKGFHGTSTREIAARVGVRQPSLFHHFPTKQAILAELLDRDLEPALARISAYREMADDPACCLYAYLLADVAALVRSPYDARGIYNDQVLDEAPMRSQREKRGRLHSETRELIAEGVRRGSFRDVDTRFAQQVITGMLLDTIWAAGTHLIDDAEARPRQVADFVLRGLLCDPDDVESVRARALEIVRKDPPSVSTGEAEGRRREATTSRAVPRVET